MSNPRIAIPLFPGTNCHEESAFAIEQAGGTAEIVVVTDLLEKRRSLGNFHGIMIVGGFAYGDYFGAGRVASILLGDQLRQFAALQRPILAVCNGFQIAMEAELFRGSRDRSGGALIDNTSFKFEMRTVTLAVTPNTLWTEGWDRSTLTMPSAHAEGRYTGAGITNGHLIPVFRYASDWDGRPANTYPDNPNGSFQAIAGVANGLTLGMMPHPERAIADYLGSTDGRLVFDSFVRLARA